MDSVFLVEDEPRARFLRRAVRTLGCTYICLWSYLPHPSNCLISMDGWYNDENNPASSSSGSLHQSLFYAYRRSLCSIENGGVPGFAFKEGVPYLELRDSDILNSASTDAQRQFYQEAGIKTAAFMGCRSGEIEYGSSTSNQINMQMDPMSLFTEDFINQSQLREPWVSDHSRPSSSSSSLRSLSVSSPEYSSLILNMANNSYLPPDLLKEPSIEQVTRPASIVIQPHQQALNQFPNIQFPTLASDEAAMTRAMLAVISSPSSSSTCYQASQSRTRNYQVGYRKGAFKPYISSLAPNTEIKPNSRSQRILKLVFGVMRSISLTRIEAQLQETRPTSNQLHHMISERRRREKLNDSFHALRSLLPPGSKKDKASVLTNTREYMCALKAQVLELKEKIQLLETRLPPAKQACEDTGFLNERVEIQVIKAIEATSALEDQEIELRATVRGDCDLMGLVLEILQCLKQMKHTNLVTVEVDTQLHQTNSVARASIRLKVKASEWDEGTFKEAVTRAVADVTR